VYKVYNIQLFAFKIVHDVACYPVLEKVYNFYITCIVSVNRYYSFSYCWELYNYDTMRTWLGARMSERVNARTCCGN